MMLEVEKLRMGYSNGRIILHDLGFTLQPGQILTILGPNGVGKTTLLRCVNAMLRPWSGQVLLDNIKVAAMARQEIARNFGYVSQRAEGGGMTAFDAVLLGRKPHLRWRSSREDLQKTDGALRRLGLAHLALRRTDELSGGELQKVCIARALVQEPKVLLLDEPTSSLDLKNQLEILEIIRRVADEQRIGAVITLHDLNLALRFMDRFLLVRQGRVFAAGSPEQLTAEMIFAVYGVQVDIVRHKGRLLVVPDQLAQ
ncbi:MAG: ABC transporter ATP-binding protein [Desulfurivibrionaceae bacterium]|nr:ABC transporter ATP-binding protein [Desulfurivibrionaceae bacterium]